ncbi:MAG: hypothetical protein L6V93_00980 [Clostridiales bacterium]|nr:MAG: hypothetical protein L6V93_00980 [Clostridiales bacterium]
MRFCEKSKPLPVYYSGTGDVFASVLCGALTNGKRYYAICEKFLRIFVEKCVLYSKKCGIYPNEGVGFEKVFLGDLVNTIEKE